MSDVVIRVEGLGKRYRIGAQQIPYRTLREAITNVARAPARRLKRIWSGEASSVSKNTIWALKDVSFEVEQAQVIGVIGRNGAGKTTLLKVLSRITKPTEGSVELNGRVGSLLEVGTGFHPELTGRENIYLNGAILGMRRAEIDHKFDEIVSFAEIEQFLDTPVKHYSSGMYVRLAFAVAAHLESEILLVDEVLAVGDAAFQKKCMDKMGEVAKRGRTVLFVSHNMVAVQRFCPRVILLDGGHLVTDGTSLEAIREYSGGMEGIAERTWDDPTRAPGTSLYKIKAVRVKGDDGVVTSELDSRSPVDIEIEYLNLKPGARLGASIVLYNSENICVLSSISNHDPWYGRPRDPGLFQSKCRIPGNFLAEGRYRVTVIIWADKYLDAHVEEWVVEFNVREIEGVRGDYLGGMDGVVRPLLDWSTSKLG